MNQIIRFGAEILGVLTLLWGFLGIVGGINTVSSFQWMFLLMGFSNVLAGLIISPTGYSFISKRTGIQLSIGLRILLYLLLTFGIFLGVIVYAPLPTFG
jgi:hypothetical protein